MSVLTDQQKEDYIANGGIRCPFCDSDDIGGGSVTVEAGVAIQHVRCPVCRQEWTDIYRLVEVSQE